MPVWNDKMAGHQAGSGQVWKFSFNLESTADASTKRCPSCNPVLICIMEHKKKNGRQMEAHFKHSGYQKFFPVAFHGTLGSKFHTHCIATGLSLNYHWLRFTGDPLHSRAACTQPCNVNTHSRAHCSPCVNNRGTAVWTMGHSCVQVPGCVEGHPWGWGNRRVRSEKPG